MKKVNNMGFFLVETMVVIAVVGLVLTYLFKTFSGVYTRFNTSEYYNTVEAINAAGDIKQYVDKSGVSYEDMIGTNTYVDLTTDSHLTGDYYSALISKLKISKVYLIDMQDFFADANNLNNFNIDLRKYIKTLENDNAQYKIIAVTQNNEYGSMSAFDYYLTLTGDANDEYAVYVPLNGTYTDPGYESKDSEGNNLTVTITGVVTTSTAGTYYLNYNVGAISTRRKVVVYKQIYNYDYTGNYQKFIAPVDGKYQIELWGAQGGSFSPYLGGKGAYTVGQIFLTQGTIFYVYVGGAAGTGSAGGYNGGGSLTGGQEAYGRAGGGATDVRFINASWSLETGLRSRIMVAAGGGGANNRNAVRSPVCGFGAGAGGYGGGLTGGDGETLDHTYNSCTWGWSNGTGATQTSGGLNVNRDDPANNSTDPGNVISSTSAGTFGYANSFSQSGGGGGSSYIKAGAINTEIIDGQHLLRQGDGYARIIEIP
jgi:type II secretory pathway pseudopilin PulG